MNLGKAAQMTQPELALSYTKQLADLCRAATGELTDAVQAFAKLKAAIEAQGYIVVHHMHSGEYSLFKQSTDK